MFSVLFFLLLLSFAALPGWGLLRRLGVESSEAWALGRVVGPILIVFPAWWAGSLGLENWPLLAGLLLTVFGILSLYPFFREKTFKEIAQVELVFWSFSLMVLFLRAGRPAISETEKFMDMGIISNLMRCTGFPPRDFWLAGKELPYYYWGGLPWATALRGSGLGIGLGYNLILALLAGMTALMLWSLGRRLSGTQEGGWMAAFFGILAGTPDGLRQILAGIRPLQVDLWASSRQISGAITEFPLFSFRLGDLHPHVLSMPLALAAIALAAAAGAAASVRLLPLVALLFGLSWAANPWSMPPTLAGVALMLLCSDGQWHWPKSRDIQRWLWIIGVGAGGFLLSLPFHLNFHPPSHPIRPVFAWTPPLDFLLYAGIFVLPLCMALIRAALKWGEGRKALALTIAALGATLVLGVIIGRPLIPLLSLALAVLVALILEPGRSEDRPALALAALAVFLFLIPELVYVQDGYGADLHRMNTIFKAYIQAWIFMALALPVLIRKATGSLRGQRVLLVILLVMAMPHLLSASLNSLARIDTWSLDGLAWMSPRDSGLVRELQSLPPESSLIEAVGDAYSEYGRLSAASGVPAYLGWANHERVWRGVSINQETARRRSLVKALYSASTPEEARKLADSSGVDLVAFGDLEAQDFGPDSLSILSRAGDHRVECAGGGVLVFFKTGVPKP